MSARAVAATVALSITVAGLGCAADPTSAPEGLVALPSRSSGADDPRGPSAMLVQSSSLDIEEEDANTNGACNIRLAADPGAEAPARKTLEAIAPKAQMTFSTVRGTPSTITNLNLPLGNCPRGRSTGPALRGIVEGSPDLFRVDADEWDTVAPSCDAVPESGEWIRWNRITYGEMPVRRDVLGLLVRRVGFSVQLAAIAGTYLPLASKKVRAAMKACPVLDVARAESAARKMAHGYETFQSCSPTGAGVYSAEPADQLALLDPYWEWSERAGGIDLASRHRAVLRVAPANHTPPLLASNANCPLGGVSRVAFSLVFDAPSSSIVESSPGEDCVVCLASP